MLASCLSRGYKGGMSIFTRTQQMGLAAVMMSASILLSRLMGLIRDKVISWQYGASGEADLYFMAFIVPDFINHLLAGGYVSITLIPLLAKCFAEGEEDGWAFFSSVFWWLVGAALVLTGVCWAYAPELAGLVAPRFEAAQVQRLAFFLRIILPAQIFFLMGVNFSALLYLRRQFSVPALTPLIYNGCIILGGVSLPYFGLVSGMEGFCWGVTLGAALGAFLLPLLTAWRGGVRVGLVFRHRLMGRFVLLALPLVLGQSVVVMDEQFLRIFGGLTNDGAVSLLSYARRISQVPVAVVGQAAAVASYPFLASLLARGETGRFESTLNTAIRSGLLLIIPLSVFLIAAAEPALCCIFQGGQFSSADTRASVPLLQLLLAAVPFWIVQMVLGRGFYAHSDTITPAVVGSAVSAVSVPAFWAVARLTELGAWGIALVSMCGVLVYAVVLCMIWRRRYGGGALAGLAGLGLRALGLSLPAGGVAWWGCGLGMAQLSLPPFFTGAIAGALGLVLFMGVYMSLARYWAPELLAPFPTLLHRGRKRAE